MLFFEPVADGDSKGAPDACRFDAVNQAMMKMVVFIQRVNLRFVRKATKRR